MWLSPVNGSITSHECSVLLEYGDFGGQGPGAPLLQFRLMLLPGGLFGLQLCLDEWVVSKQQPHECQDAEFPHKTLQQDNNSPDGGFKVEVCGTVSSVEGSKATPNNIIMRVARYGTLACLFGIVWPSATLLLDISLVAHYL